MNRSTTGVMLRPGGASLVEVVDERLRHEHGSCRICRCDPRGWCACPIARGYQRQAAALLRELDAADVMPDRWWPE